MCRQAYLDVRTEQEFVAGHPPNALNVVVEFQGERARDAALTLSVCAPLCSPSAVPLCVAARLSVGLQSVPNTMPVHSLQQPTQFCSYMPARFFVSLPVKCRRKRYGVESAVRRASRGCHTRQGHQARSGAFRA